MENDVSILPSTWRLTEVTMVARLLLATHWYSASLEPEHARLSRAQDGAAHCALLFSTVRAWRPAWSSLYQARSGAGTPPARHSRAGWGAGAGVALARHRWLLGVSAATLKHYLI